MVGFYGISTIVGYLIPNPARASPSNGLKSYTEHSLGEMQSMYSTAKPTGLLEFGEVHTRKMFTFSRSKQGSNKELDR